MGCRNVGSPISLHVKVSLCRILYSELLSMHKHQSVYANVRQGALYRKKILMLMCVCVNTRMRLVVSSVGE